jgi:uncharacterized tellurite resistance protein B-like protein
MKASALIIGLVGLAILSSSFGLGLLLLVVAVGLWAVDSSQKAKAPSRSAHSVPRQRETATTAVKSRPATPVARPAAVMQWLKPGDHVIVHGHFITGALIYYSQSPPMPREASCIDLSLPVGKPIAEPKGSLGYWPQYAEISPDQRANYLQWLASGRRGPLEDIGYAFIYFYGLERRTLIDGEDQELILDELVRLLGRYRQSASFNSYLGGLIEYVSARRGIGDLSDSWFERFLAHSVSSTALAWLATHDRPLPVDLAFIVAKRDERSPRSVVSARVPEQFGELFRRKYHECFGKGMRLRSAARDHRIEYHPGSITLLHAGPPQASTALDPISIPNVYGIQSQFKPLVRIWSECVEELRPLSRRAAKDADLTTREAYWALPAELRAEADHPDRWKWEEVVAAQTSEGAFVILPVSSLAVLQGIEERPKLTRKQSDELAATACTVGFGITPDCRAVGRPYRWDQPVALFPMEQPVPPKDAAFACATCMVELGIALAAADGTVDDQEVLHITEFVNNQFSLSPDDALHLDGYRRVLLRQPPRMTSLGRRLEEKLTADQREQVARFLVGVAAASGNIHRKEITALRAAYRSLGIDPIKLDGLLNEIRGPEEPVEVQAAASTTAGEAIPVRTTTREAPMVVLDMSRVQRLFAGTAEVQRILAGAMMATEEVEEAQSVPQLAKAVNPTALTVVPMVPLELLRGLDQRYYPVLNELLTREAWQPQKIDTLARKHGFMRSGMLGVINEWAMEQFGDLLVDDGQAPYTINRGSMGQTL